MKTLIQKYIIDAIENEDDSSFDNLSDNEKLVFLFNRFRNEKPNNIKSIKSGLTNWMQGLPSTFNVVFEHDEVEALVIKYGLLPPESDETHTTKYDIYVNNWFNFLAGQFYALYRQAK